MIAFIGVAFLMVVAALGFLLPPLLRARAKTAGASESDANLAVYRHQVRELAADRDAGVVSASAFDESRLELERRLVVEVNSNGAVGDRVASGESGRGAAVVIGIAMPLVAAALYWHFGTPQAIVAPPSGLNGSPHGPAHSTSPGEIDAMVDGLAARLAKGGKNGKDGDGWAMLARSYAALDRHAEAVPAYERAVALLPDDAQLLADYADALAVTGKGRLDGKPAKLLLRALRIDPENVKALALLGTAAFDRKDYAGAAALWERAVNAAPPGEDFTASLQANLAEARSLSAGRAGPTTVSRDSAASTKASARTVSGQVSLASELADRVSPDDSVLLFARAAEGPRMPLALVKRHVRDLPLEFVLDDDAAMMASMKLSSFDRVVIVARISKTASAQAQSGDLEGTVGPVAVGSNALRIRIDRALP